MEAMTIRDLSVRKDTSWERLPGSGWIDGEHADNDVSGQVAGDAVELVTKWLSVVRRPLEEGAVTALVLKRLVSNLCEVADPKEPRPDPDNQPEGRVDRTVPT